MPEKDGRERRRRRWFPQVDEDMPVLHPSLHPVIRMGKKSFLRLKIKPADINETLAATPRGETLQQRLIVHNGRTCRLFAHPTMR